MKHSDSFNVYGSDRLVKYEIDHPEKCPICRYSIEPKVLSCNLINLGSCSKLLSITFFCTHCHRPFIAEYSSSNIDSPVSMAPSAPPSAIFQPSIAKISPQFVKIYNQALAAEFNDLDELSGIGYRKALEFLIKDFAVYLHPDERDNIISAPLSRCISAYIPDEDIRALASRAAWLGNDFTHYSRRFSDFDIDDLRRFIGSAVYWITAKLNSIEAQAIQARR